MRLIKLAAFSLLGYVLYELFLGITEEVEKQHNSSNKQVGGSRELRRALNENQGRMSGGGEGQPVETIDSTGSTTRHFTGRGVISR